MQTVRQIERMWSARQYERMFRELSQFRPEAELLASLDTGSLAAPAAAMAMIRLDELSQSHAPVHQALVRCLIASQDHDGGWHNPLLTALCLRALMCSRGGGEAIERGLTYLAELQKDEGIWPHEPVRRLPGDAWVSAFILHHLGLQPAFRAAVHFDAAMSWFETHVEQLDAATEKLWARVALRCHFFRAPLQMTFENIDRPMRQRVSA